MSLQLCGKQCTRLFDVPLVHLVPPAHLVAKNLLGPC